MNTKQTSLFTDPLDSCPLCSCTDFNPLYDIDSWDLKFHTDKCSNCGFIFTNPRFCEDIIDSFYSEDYFKGNADYSYVDERDIKKFASYVWDKRIKIIRKYVKNGNFLDIGSSFGGLLESAEPFFEPYGIELSPYAGGYSQKKFGKNIHIGKPDDHPFEHNFFSVITMIELIEHLPSPVEVLEECFCLLKKDGLLVIQTANMDGRQAINDGKDYAYFMPGHLSYFSKRNLTDLLHKTGFSKVKVYQPVEFGLLPKLLKSRGSFKSLGDYRQWLRISYYHAKSLVHFRNFALTSSMVIYAVK